MILTTNLFSFLSTCTGRLCVSILVSGIMEISLQERAQLPAPCLYGAEEEGGESREMVSEE